MKGLNPEKIVPLKLMMVAKKCLGTGESKICLIISEDIGLIVR